MTAIEPYRGGPERQAVIMAPAGGEGPGKGDNINFGGLIPAFRQRLGLFLTVLGVTLALVVVFLFVFPAQYTATARVAVDARAVSTTPEKETPVVSQLPTQSTADIDTEVQIIQSRRVIGRVVDMLHLDKDPEFARGNPGLLGKTTKMLTSLFTPPAATSKRDEVINAVQTALLPVRFLTTNAIDINFTDHDARKAQRIANAFARAYLDDQVQAKFDKNREASAGELAQIEKMRLQADEDSARVQAYKIAHGLLSLGAQSLTEQEISTYNQGIAAAKAEAAGDQANLRTAQDQLARGSNGDDVGEALNSPVVGALRGQRAVLSAKLADLEGHYGPKYPDLAQARQQLADVDQEIKAEIQRTISNLAAKAAVSQKRLEAMEATLAHTQGTLVENNAADVGLENLNRAATVSQSIYEAYLARSKESVAQTASLIPDAEIVSEAGLPEYPSFPIAILFLALGLVAGVLFGSAAVLIAETTENRLVTAEDVERQLGCPYLGGIPLLASVSKTSRSPIDTVVAEPSSAYSEAFRALLATVGFSTPGTTARVVLVTSALPLEGKTTVAVGLARTCALQRISTVLVDCDARRRGASRDLNLDGSQPGLLNVLSGDATLSEALIPDIASGVMVLPMSEFDHSSHELLSGEAMDMLLDELRAQFQTIILDTAPTLPIAATRVLATKADTVLLVARWRKTSETAVRAALRLLLNERVQLAGIALACVDLRQMSKYTGADAGRFFKKFMEYYA
ncbi:MAG TPA: Wzz/FepE/Etk N-terminal domain-containing protein [Caulobacteraceae bacterium]|jgi:capsular exopolysaccharide synthesis family protein|nr:Wzz/FepE/Etk N-terminal domain-containing protein [Caulobacteraceae bacterium]